MSNTRRLRRPRRPRPGDLTPVTAGEVRGGYPCPYCRRLTWPGVLDDVWRCACGWSGVLLAS